MAIENPDRLHAAITVRFSEPLAQGTLEVVASAGIELASIQTLQTGLYVVQLSEGIADAELSISTQQGIRSNGDGGIASGTVVQVTRGVNAGIPDPDLRTFLINAEGFDSGVPDFVNAEIEFDVQWFRISEAKAPLPLPLPPP